MNRLALDNVSVRFGAVQALSKVSIELAAGQVMMMIGPNGAGKSTLARVLLGLVRPQEGSFEIDGKPRKVDNAFKKHLGYLPEAVAFSDNLKGRQVMRFFSWARGVPSKRIDTALERVGLAHAARRKVRGYSKGMRQRLGLAVAILAEPTLLILDEPTGGLDSEGLSVLWSVLDEWRNKGRMVLMASHHLDLLERHVDTISVFKGGHVLAEGTPDELRRSVLIPHRVTLRLSDDVADADAVAGLERALDGWAHGTTTRAGGALVVETRAESLLALMDVRAEFCAAVSGLRIEEPSLDMVYQRLLEREAAPDEEGPPEEAT